MIIKKCGICRKRDMEGKSYGDLGDYCKDCVERIKAHIKGLKLEQESREPKSKWGRSYGN